MPVRTRTLFCSVLILLTGSSVIFAGSIGLAWDSASGAAGYRVHYGTNSGAYTSSIDVGNVTDIVFSGPADCTTSYFAVTAYNAAGQSGYSNEVASWPRPTIASASPPRAKQGDLLTLDLAGINFQNGATVEIDNPNVVLDEVTVQSCDSIQIATTVEPTAAGVMAAEVGRFSMTITNPDLQTTVANQIFEVQVNPARFDVVRGAGGPSDNRLDGRDALLLSRLFGSQLGEAEFDPDLDFNGDGWVDGGDLAYLAGNLGKCWNGSGWTVAACPQGLR